MTQKILLLAVMAVALLTLQVASTDSYGDRDWIHHTFSLLEISTTDIVTPSPLFYGTAPLQNGTPLELQAVVVFSLLLTGDMTRRCLG